MNISAYGQLSCQKNLQNVRLFFSGSLTNEQLVRYGLADANESPAMITDIGMKAVGQVFTNVKTLSIYNCPHLLYPTAWFTQGKFMLVHGYRDE